MRAGLGDSLAGRFEIIPATHWRYPECCEAFGWDVDTFVFYGGYPGAGLVTGLPKYSGGALRRRASSPKLQVMNTALMTALRGRTRRR